MDQGIRDGYVLKTFSKEISSVMPTIDSINFQKFLNLVKEYGYPSKIVPEKYRKYESIKYVGLVMLLHNPHRLVEPDVYTLFKNEVKEGRLNAEIFAMALDKYYVIYEGKSLYNSQFKALPTLTIKGVSVLDRQLSDSLRTDIGLTPLSEHDFIHPQKK